MSDLHLIGTELDDVLTGGDGNDWLEGLGGDDTLTGGFGNNLLDGGAGSDTVAYTTHDNGYAGVFVDLGAGYAAFIDLEWVDGWLTPIFYTDTLVNIENAEGSDFDDTLIGSAADNRLSGLGGYDHLDGGAGDDVLTGGSGADQLDGDVGDDMLDGGSGADQLDGGAGDDVLDGGEGADYMDGGDGDDTFVIALGGDSWLGETIAGGAGYDAIHFTSTTAGDMLFLGENDTGIERIVLGGGAGDTTALNVNARFLLGGVGVTIIGNDGANFLGGTYWSDSLFGGGGDDLISAGGDDFYDGGAGSDTVLYSGLNSPLFVDLEAGYAMFDGVYWQDGERIVFDEYTDTLIDIENIEGGDDDDQLFGSAAANRLFGRHGNDLLSGLGGDDYLDGGAGIDTVVVASGVGAVLIDLGAGYAVSADGSTDTLVDIENAESGDFGDRLFGSSAANRLAGMGGDDVLWGLDGDDHLDGGTGSDVLHGGTGNDVYEVDAGGSDWVYEYIGDDTVYWHGVSADQVERVRASSWESNSNDLTLRIAGTTDTLTLSYWFYQDPYTGQMVDRVERVVFDDGTVWDASVLGSLSRLGTPGNDFLFGTEWSETFVGFGGSDYVQGGGGDDVALLQQDGQDWVFDASGDDEVRWHGVTPNAAYIERIRLDGSDDLTLRIAGTTDTLTLGSWFLDPQYRVERVVFTSPDETVVWGAEELASLTYYGTEGSDWLYGTQWSEAFYGLGGNDVIQGYGGDDTLDGGWGGDFLIGGEGSDTYVLDSNFNRDLVWDVSALGSTEVNVLLLQGGWGGHEFAFRGISSDLLIALGSGLIVEDEVTLKFFLDSSVDTIDEIRFADGSQVGIFRGDGVQTSYDGTATVDIFLGSSAIAETFYGGTGHDLYVVGNGPADTIYDFQHETGGNQVHFANLTLADNLTFGHRNGFFVASVDGYEVLRIAGFNNQDALNLPVVMASFMDGTTRALGELVFERGYDIHATGVISEDFVEGTSIDDRIYGSAQSELLVGYDGHDSLFGGGGQDTLHGDGLDGIYGNDYLDGGAGNDSLFGGNGADTYYFDRQSGNDWVLELVALEEEFGYTDRVVFGPDITVDDLIVSLDHLGRFLITIDGSPASLLFNEWFNTEISTRVERFEFADGTVLTDEDVTALLPDAPVVANPLADQAAAEDAPFSFAVPANAFDDADLPIGDSLAYGARLANGGALPSWLAFDAATRTFSGTALNQHVGTLAIEVTATDESGRSASDVFDFTLVNTNDAPTLANPIADRAAQDTVAFSYGVPANTFADVDANDTFVWSATQAGGGALPSWLSFNAATRAFTGTPNAASIGDLDVSVTATDSAGAAVSDAFRITVAAAPDQTLTGNSGSNTLTGGSGNDTLNGMGGADNMTGLLGNDSYFVDNSGDQVNEAANGGTDTVNSSINYTLGSNVENLTLTGSANRSGTGNALNNTLLGNSGNNVLNGGAGNDILNGGTGSDTFVFNQLPGAANADLIQGFTSSDRIQLDNAVMAALGSNGSFSSNDARFWFSTTGLAHDSSDRVIYNTNTGELWYDANGSAAGGAQLIATLENDPSLTASQISVI